MSDNRPEWQHGENPAADGSQGSEESQYGTSSQPAPPSYPGQDGQGSNASSGYPSYGQEGSSPYAQQGSSYGQSDQYGQSQYGQQPAGYPAQTGYPSYGESAYPVPRENPGQAMGIAGLITSFFISVVGLVLSIIGLNQSRKVGMGNVPAVVGIIVGGLGTLLGALFFLLIFIGIAAETSSY